jgi:hypothetical protein
MNWLNNSRVLLALKVVLFILLLGFIYYGLFVKQNFAELWEEFAYHLQWGRVPLLIIVLLLMPVNWLLETVKWRQLLGSANSFTDCAKGVLSGITIGFITPGRSGEFIGRIMHFNENEKSKVFYLSTMGGLAQSAVTILIGALSFPYWKDEPFVSGLIIGIAAVFSLLYFKFEWLSELAMNVPVLANKGMVIYHTDLPGMDARVKVYGLSLLRYAVYLLQYVLVFYFFEVSTDVPLLIALCAVMLMLNSFSPLMPVLDFSFRGSIAIMIFVNFTNNLFGAVVAGTVIWMVNLVIPALIGYIFIVRKK